MKKILLAMVAALGIAATGATAATDNRVLNGDFSAGQTNWALSQSGNFNGSFGGDAYMFHFNNQSNSLNAFRAITQSVDFTDVDELTFDYRTTAVSNIFNRFAAEVLIGSTTVFSETSLTASSSNGFPFTNEVVNVTGFTGVQTLTFRLRAITTVPSGTGSQRVEWDNITAFAPAATVPLPAAAWMLLAGVGAMGAARRFKRA